MVNVYAIIPDDIYARFHINVKGHAEKHESDGIDRVCAGASMLAMTLAQCVKDAQRDGQALKDVYIRINNGYALIECIPTDQEAYYELMHSFRTILTGYRVLASNFPDAVSVNVKG